jgi:hypothetical protein
MEGDGGARQGNMLQSVYSALENNNYARAIKLCATTKAIAGWTITKALKAHALERSGGHQHREEALGLILESLGWKSFVDEGAATGVGGAGPGHGITDETTLSTVAVTLRVYKLFGAVVRLYSEGVAACQEKMKQTGASSNKHVLLENYHSALKALIHAHVRRLSTIPHGFLCDIGRHGVPSFSEELRFKDGVTLTHTSMAFEAAVEADWLFLRLAYGRTTRENGARGTSVEAFDDSSKDQKAQASSLVGYYEDLQTTAMQLARNINLPQNATLYWSWAVWSILLHYQAVLLLSEKNHEEDAPSLQLKRQMLPALAENLCRTKVVQLNNLSHNASGEDWRLYLRSLLAKCTSSADTCDHQYGEVLSLLEERVSTNDPTSSSATSIINDETDIRSAHGSILPMSTRDKMELLTMVHRLQPGRSCVDFYKKLLASDEQGGAQWSSLVGLLRAALDDQSTSMGDALLDCQTFVIENFLGEFASHDNQNGNNRGPHLLLVEIAAISLDRHLRSDRSSTASPEDEMKAHIHNLQQAMAGYLKLFCSDTPSLPSRPSCVYGDLRPYLGFLARGWCEMEDATVAHQQIASWLKSLAPLLQANKPFSCDDKDDSSKGLRMKLRSYTTLCQLIHETIFLSQSAYPSVVDSIAEVLEHCSIQSMIQIWTQSLSVADWVAAPSNMDRRQKHKELREGQKEGLPGDDLLILVAHLLMREALALNLSGERCSDDGVRANHSAAEFGRYVLTAVALLEHGVRHSPYNAGVKIAMMRACSMLTAGARVAQLGLEDLRLKQIQHESLSYLTLDCSLRSGMYRAVSSQALDILKLHRSCASDTPPFIMEALGSGNLGVSLDILHFQVSQMNTSCQSLQAKALIMDMAPLVGLTGISSTNPSQRQKTANNQREKQTTMIGNMHGIVGLAETDNERVLQILQDAHEPHSAPSILHEVSTLAEDNNYTRTMSRCSGVESFSDNRDFDVLDYALVTGSPHASTAKSKNELGTAAHSRYALLVQPATKVEMVDSSLEAAHFHGLLVHAVLLQQTLSLGSFTASGASSSNKGKKKHHKKKGKGGRTSTESSKGSAAPQVIKDDKLFVQRRKAFQDQVDKAKHFRLSRCSVDNGGHSMSSPLFDLGAVNLDLADAFGITLDFLSARASSGVQEEKDNLREAGNSKLCHLLQAATQRVVDLHEQVSQHFMAGMASSAVSHNADKNGLLDPLTLAMIGTLVPKRLVSTIALVRHVKSVLEYVPSDSGMSTNSEKPLPQSRYDSRGDFNKFCSSMQAFLHTLKSKL